MNPLRRLVTAFVAALGIPAQAQLQSKESSAEAGKKLRLMALGTKAADIGLTSSPSFPRVFGVIMDWPIGDQIATVVSLSDGTASLYTTSTFGIIGGHAHETVRAAGKRFIAAAERHYDEATPAVSYPYPDADQILFYLLCYEGVRVVKAALGPTQDGTSTHGQLFSSAQEVLTQLRQNVSR